MRSLKLFAIALFLSIMVMPAFASDHQPKAPDVLVAFHSLDGMSEYSEAAITTNHQHSTYCVTEPDTLRLIVFYTSTGTGATNLAGGIGVPSEPHGLSCMCQDCLYPMSMMPNGKKGGGTNSMAQLGHKRTGPLIKPIGDGHHFRQPDYVFTC